MTSSFLKNTVSTRYRRIALSLFLPPVVGSVLYCMYIVVTTGDLAAITMIFLVMLYAFFLMTPQSLVYAVLMEFPIRRRAKNKAQLVCASCLLGIAAGLTLSLLLSYAFTVIGFTVGIMLGLLLSIGFEPEYQHKTKASN